VLVKNTDNNVGRIVKAVLLDHHDLDAENTQRNENVASTSSDCVMGTLPCRSFPGTGSASLDENAAYLSPLLAFNLGLHVSCLKLLIQKAGGRFKFCSHIEQHDATADGGSEVSVQLELLPCPQVPRYASHLRVSVVRIPECGVLASLKINSSFGGSDYQDMIDQALNEYFKFDRFLARGDVFSIRNNWNCGMNSCLACNKQDDKLHHHNMIYFKVKYMFVSLQKNIDPCSTSTDLIKPFSFILPFIRFSSHLGFDLLLFLFISR
jgi:peroxin-6